MSGKRRTRPQRPSVRPRLEELESRIAPAVFNVASNVADGAVGSLRAAINVANTNGDATNTINLVARGSYGLILTAV